LVEEDQEVGIGRQRIQGPRKRGKKEFSGGIVRKRYVKKTKKRRGSKKVANR